MTIEPLAHDDATLDATQDATSWPPVDSDGPRVDGNDTPGDSTGDELDVDDTEPALDGVELSTLPARLAPGVAAAVIEDPSAMVTRPARGRAKVRRQLSPTDVATRYRLVGEIGRGGLGRVFFWFWGGGGSERLGTAGFGDCRSRAGLRGGGSDRLGTATRGLDG